MGRGLGPRQKLVLRALVRLQREHGRGWRATADVVATVEAMVRPEPVARIDPNEATDGARLEHLNRLIRMGWREYQNAANVIETRIAERAAARDARERAAARKAALRYPNTLRSEPRSGEDLNPSRVLASLARRGLVERQAHCGPGSLVRLVPRG